MDETPVEKDVLAHMIAASAHPATSGFALPMRSRISVA